LDYIFPGWPGKKTLRGAVQAVITGLVGGEALAAQKKQQQQKDED
jgi:hypothetical protein